MKQRILELDLGVYDSLSQSLVAELDLLIQQVRADLSLEPELHDTVLHKIILKKMQEHPSYSNWLVTEKRILEKRIFSTINGLGLLEVPLADSRVTEIMVNGLDNIFVEIKGCLYTWPESFSSQSELERVIHRMISKINRVVNTAQPIVDGRLEDGSRLHVVMPPIALNGPIVTIRKFHREIKTLDHLINSDSLDSLAAQFLMEQVKLKRNVLVSGGTGTGKTTLLNILSLWINPLERIVSVEDACELNLSHVKNWVQLEVRQATSDDLGAVTMRQLVRASLRMRPDRIIVGEVRGEEVLDMLQAMNTGHEGSMSSVHANGVHDVLSRLESLLHMHTSIGLEAIKSLIISSLDVIVHLERDRDGKRYVSQIASINKSCRENYQLESHYSKEC